jgi:hypothetical protein
MIRADIYSAYDYLHQKKIVDQLSFSALRMTNLILLLRYKSGEVYN